jgi:hypothetical protein
MEVLEAPTLASPVSEVRALFEDQALATVTTTAGAVSLVLYALFAIALVRFLRLRGGPGDRWSALALVGGIAGPVVAAASLVATALLTADGGLSDDRVNDLFAFSQRVRMVSGVFVAMFLGGVGVAALRARALPMWLAWYACALAVPMVLVPFAALGEDKALAVAVGIAFAAQTAWIFLTSLWLALAEGASPLTFVRRSAFLVLVIAAGLIGIALVAVPAATGEFFAWDLAPEPLAAFAGGVYVGSATAYAVALPRSEREVRGLVVGAVILSVSVFVITLAYLELFDFDRLQAWTWVALFAGFSWSPRASSSSAGRPPPTTRRSRSRRRSACSSARSPSFWGFSGWRYGSTRPGSRTAARSTFPRSVAGSPAPGSYCSQSSPGGPRFATARTRPGCRRSRSSRSQRARSSRRFEPSRTWTRPDRTSSRSCCYWRRGRSSSGRPDVRSSRRSRPA